MSTDNDLLLARMRNARIPKLKAEKKPLRQKSLKRQQAEAAEKKALQGDDSPLEKWFKARRREMVGTCQCGCGQKTGKFDDMYFKHCIAHIFPKAIFSSVATQPLNWVERRFWEGCHTNMDERGLDKWPNMADWDDIKEKFYQLAPLLTDEERATKFYKKLESLVYSKAA